LTLREDPEGVEMKVAEKHASFKGKEVLEVGCGNGRLTLQYGESTKKVVSIDPSAKNIAEAKRSIRGKLVPQVSFQVGMGEELRFPDENLDIVFFSWSLYCIDVPAMGRALAQAWRVLRRDGLLVNMQPSLHQPFHWGTISYILRSKGGRTDNQDIGDEGDKQARLALRYASFVEGKFDFVSEEEFQTYNYYDTVSEFFKSITTENEVQVRDLDKQTRRRIYELLESMKTKQGIRVQQNAVLTVLKKVSGGT
jgi:ubiquinone/menaquinone biosynthesis C-methylase UbiE